MLKHVGISEASLDALFTILRLNLRRQPFNGCAMIEWLFISVVHLQGFKNFAVDRSYTYSRKRPVYVHFCVNS